MSTTASQATAGIPPGRHTYRINPATTLEAETAGELVEKLRKWHWAAPATSGALMVLMAREVRGRYQISVRTTTPTGFVEDMLRHGMFTILPPG